MSTQEAVGRTFAEDATPPPARRLGLLLGPAFIAAVAYVDPGNFATNIQAGSAYGYLLVWVVVVANLTAMVVQALSAKLGLVSGASLPQLIRDRSAQPVVVAAWLVAELVALATDLAELLGAALGLQLLTGLALLPGTLLVGFATFAVLVLQSRGMPLFEGLIAALVGVIAVCYVIETVMGHSNFAAAGRSLVPPRLEGGTSVLMATGILGATVMPHVIYLHSALMTDRAACHNERHLQRLLRLQAVDIVSALGLAGIVNVLMLMLAAATFHVNGLTATATIPQAYRTLTPTLGPSASAIFGISLLASGLSASAVGTLAGQTVMQGFLRRSVPVWARRLVTMLPAVVLAGVGVDATHAMVLSQVVLSFGIAPALVPLVWMTSRVEIMGALRNGPLLKVTAWLVVAMICLLNGYLLEQVVIA